MEYKMNGEQTNEARRRETEEAIAAGEQALASLQSAESYLKSAGSWGIWDMFGGGFFSGLIKHACRLFL